jgi:WD40 repeat protein
VAFSPDNSLLATGGIQDEGLRIVDAVTGQELANLYQDPASGSAAFSPDRETLAVTVIPDGFSVSQRGLHLWSYSRG